jgi:two-component system LytT family sensor kinase
MSTTLTIGELLNLIGLSTGVVLYVMLLVMVVLAERRRGPVAAPDWLPLATAVLGLTWNLCALSIYGMPKLGIDGPFRYLGALGFGALGFLPAVVVHSVLRGDRQGVRGWINRALAAGAYAVSAAAVVLHVEHAATGAQVPAPVGMRLLTYTFVGLVVPLAALTRRQPGSRRALWAAALATFAVSALHLSQLHQGDASWPIELVGHHAALPLAFAILYQDYPFALADIFLKRALSLLAVAALVFGAIATFGAQSHTFAQFVQLPRQVSVLVIVWITTVLVYPSLRRGIVWVVDTIILKRPDYRTLSSALSRRVQGHHHVDGLLSDVCTVLGPALTARSVSWCEWHPADEDVRLQSSVITGPEAARLAASFADPADARTDWDATTAIVTVPTTESPRYALVIGPLTIGRRFLSDDLEALEEIAVIAARQIDAIRLAAERYERELREREIERLATEAELRALRAQVNPHFLFNALTTIGYLIQTAPPRALQTLMRLTALLRAVLRSESELTTLGRELEVVEAYLDIERARFEERLRVIVDVPGPLRPLRVPPLVLQPLVENAVKHGIANKQAGGEVAICASLEHQAAGAALRLLVRDTGAGSTPHAFALGQKSGVGLQNVERRLAHLYGDAAALSVTTAIGDGTTVEIRLPVDAARPAEGAFDRVAG